MRVAVVLTARPSWAKLSPVVAALVKRNVDVQILACASALLERYGRVVDVVRKEYPDVPIEEVWSTYEGATLLTSAKETGALLTELGSVLFRVRPDRVVVCADRHEVLAAAQAAAYLHLPLLHLQGGERSGSIDDRVRDAITQLADLHCVSTQAARYRVYSLTGDWHGVYQTGCPSIDLAKKALSDPPVTLDELGGSGAPVNLHAQWHEQPPLAILFHPVTSEADDAGRQMAKLLEVTRGAPRLVWFSGQDAGADAIQKAIRMETGPLHTVRNLPPRRFLRVLTQCRVLIGNSSAGIREASYLGVPVINIGSRQDGRERGPNVRDISSVDNPFLPMAICQEVTRYPSSSLYGDGTAGEQIAEVIVGSRVRATA